MSNERSSRDVSMQLLLRSVSEHTSGYKLVSNPSDATRESLRLQGALPIMTFENLPQGYSGFK